MTTILKLFIFLTGSTAFGQTKADLTSIEEAILDTIGNLPEIIERQDYIDKQTNGTRRLSIYIYQKPKETKEDFYWVKAAEDNGTNFVSHFNFFVYPDHLTIKYYDTVTGEAIDLETWRKNNNK